MTGGKTSVVQGQSGVKEEWECKACTQVDRKQSRERYTETARSGKGEQEPANRGTNNEDKTWDGGLPGLQMKTEGKEVKTEVAPPPPKKTHTKPPQNN